jgi:hypothetical protein
VKALKPRHRRVGRKSGPFFFWFRLDFKVCRGYPLPFRRTGTAEFVSQGGWQGLWAIIVVDGVKHNLLAHLFCL